MTALSLRFCARALSSCGKRGPLLIAMRGPLTIAASLVAEHRLQTRRLSNCGSRAQLLRRMWDLPRPGLEPVSPALAGRPPTAAPPGKPPFYILASFIKDKVTICAWVYLCAFYPVPLIYISVFVPVPYCLDYCSSVVQSEVREPDSSNSVFLSQDCFGYSGSFVFPYKL